MNAKFLSRLVALCFGLALGAAPALAQGDARPATRTSVQPYLELNQGIFADLGDDGDVLTYTSIAAGVDGRIETRRVRAQMSYRYERRIPWNGNLRDQDIHSGLAVAQVDLVPNKLKLDAGALAARASTDGRSSLAGFDGDATSEVYALYAGPSLSTRIGDATVAASYRLGYVTVDDHRIAGLPGNRIGFDSYGDSVSHTATASVGMAPRDRPFGWKVGVGYVREDSDPFDQRYEGTYVRGDVVVPVSPTFAVTGGIGYEKIESTLSNVVRDANGVPVVTPGGGLTPDPNGPRLVSYDQDGIIWDVGFIYRPGRHTELQARAGQRYGGLSVTGSLRHRLNRDWHLNVELYDSVSSYGRLLLTDINALPIDFDINRNPLDGSFGSCVFGQAGGGVCFDDSLRAIRSATFRNRGVNATLSGKSGVWSYGIGTSYANRKYLAPEGFTLNDVSDDMISLYGSASRRLSRTSGMGFDAYASWYDSELSLFDPVFSTGVSAHYYRRMWLDRLQGRAAVGLFATDAGPFDTIGASALIGLRYTF